jgi:hypothetical protein
MRTVPKIGLRTFFINNQNFILILISAALLVLMIRQNWSLRGQVAAGANREKALAQSLELSRDMMQLVGSPLPFAPRLRELAKDDASPGGNHVVVVFNPTACGKCLREQLTIVRSFQERLGPRSLDFLGLVGADTREDQSYVLMLRSAKLMGFPFSYARSQELSKLFPLQAETGYSDTPIYLLVDRDFRIKSVFKPHRSKPETLERWLERRLAAEEDHHA